VSMKFMPASIPACRACIDASSSTSPHDPPIAQAPNPIPDTVMSVRPSCRCSMTLRYHAVFRNRQRMTVHLRAVLWDLDGTLVDSAELHWLSWRDTLAAEGHTITYAQFLETFGQKNDRILPGWLGAETTPERIREVGDAKEAAYRELVQDRGLTPLPGAAEWLRTLHASGWKQAIASSAP